MFLESTVFHSFLDLYASEYSARLIAMTKATDSAEEMIDDLTLGPEQDEAGADHQGDTGSNKRSGGVIIVTNKKGIVSQVIGPVVDVEFGGEQPSRYLQCVDDKGKEHGMRSCAAHRRRHGQMRRHVFHRRDLAGNGCFRYRQPHNCSGRR